MPWHWLQVRSLVLILILISSSLVAQVPPEAWQYRGEMLKSAWREFGPDAPVATLAAQIHQESLWNANAVSWANAQGLAQFMPLTGKDMATRFPHLCAPANPFNASWSFRCRDKYMNTLLKANRNTNTTECDEWAFGLKAYNGGLRWVRKDRALTKIAGDNPDYWVIVNHYNSGRSRSAFKENHEYPIRIFKHTVAYGDWGRGLSC